MQDTILSTELRKHIKKILLGNQYAKKSLDGIDDQVSMLVANFEKNIALNTKYTDLKIKINKDIFFNKKAWNDWCDLDKLRKLLKIDLPGLEAKSMVGIVTVKTTTASKKDLVKQIHSLQDLIRNLSDK